MKQEKYEYILRHGKGIIKLYKINKWLGEIEGLLVASTERRNGLGSALLHKVEETAMENGLGKLSLLSREDNCPARRLFEKFGYEKEATLMNHFKSGEHMIVYSKFL